MGGGASVPVPDVLDIEAVTLLAETHGYDVELISSKFQELSTEGEMSRQLFDDTVVEMETQRNTAADSDTSVETNTDNTEARGSVSIDITQPCDDSNQKDSHTQPPESTDPSNGNNTTGDGNKDNGNETNATAKSSSTNTKAEAKDDKAKSFSDGRTKRAKRKRLQGLKLNSCSSSANFNISKVLPHLYLGASDASGLLPTLRALRITRIVNCSEKLPNHHQGEIDYLRIPLPDEPSSNLAEYFNQAATFIHQITDPPATDAGAGAGVDAGVAASDVAEGKNADSNSNSNSNSSSNSNSAGNSESKGDDVLSAEQQTGLSAEETASLKDKPEAVFVHCSAGMSRSATITIAYLIKHQDMSLIQALQVCKEARPVVSPNQGFMEQLVKFEVSVRGTPTIDMKKYIENGRFGDVQSFAVIEDGGSKAESKEDGGDGNAAYESKSASADSALVNTV